MSERTSQPPSFPAIVQQFFTDYLVAQRAVSPRTVACYRDAITLFLDFASKRFAKVPTAMQLADITPELILAMATAAIETPSGWQAATTWALNSGLCLRRRGARTPVSLEIVCTCPPKVKWTRGSYKA